MARSNPSLDVSRFPLRMKTSRPVIGSYTRFEAGEVVLARPDGDGLYAIRKVVLPEPAFPLNCVLVGVPADHLCEV